MGKSSECFRMTAGVKSGKAQNEQMFSGLPPKADLPPDLRTTPAARAPGERCHRGLARRLVAVRGRGVRQSAHAHNGRAGSE